MRHDRHIAKAAGALGIFFFVLVLFALSGCTEKPALKKGNILFLVIDTLRADHLGAYGYERDTSPHLDRLAAQSAVFDKAHSHSPWTMPSMASYFTSLTPRDHGIVNWRQPMSRDYLTLAEHLKDHGYHTYGFVSHVIFRPKYNFDQGFDHYDYSVLDIGDPADISSSREIADLAVAALREPVQEPFFMWVHFFDPHNAYLHHPEFDFGPEKMDKYDSEIRYTDEHLGRVLTALEQQGLAENTIVFFGADHGEEFWEHGGHHHSTTLYEELIRIPMMMRVPGFAPARSDTVIAESDIAPTLCRMVGVPIPRPFAGLPISYDETGFTDDRDRVIFAETLRFANKRGVIADSLKYIHDIREDKRYLFDLDADPGESTNLFDRRPDDASRLEGLVDGHYRYTHAQIEEQELPDQLREELRSLGYIE